MRSGSQLLCVPAYIDQVLVIDRIQNVIQTISPNPLFHKDHAVRGDIIGGRYVLRNCSATKLTLPRCLGVSVQSATRKNESAAPETADRVYAPAAKRAKLSVLLVTRDDMLWPQIGSHV